jgi:nucleoside-diphosphate-sugar epimerase
VTAIEDECDYSDILSGVDVVYHLASRVHVMQESAPNALALYRRVNVDASLNLARQAALAGISRFVFVSTAKVHGDSSERGHATSELAPLLPADTYAASKCEAEHGLHAIAAMSRMEIVIVRPPLVYGPGVKANFAALMRAVKGGWPLPLGAISNSRSLVSLGNLVDFLMVCGKHPAAANEAFLVSDGVDLSTPDLVRAIATAAGQPPSIFYVPIMLLRAGGVVFNKSGSVSRLCDNLQLDITKAQSLLGWRPPFSVAEGMRRAMSSEAYQ